MKYSLLVLLIALLCSARAQTCCSGGVPIAANIGMAPADVGIFQASLNYDINVLTSLKAGTTLLDDDTRIRKTQSIMLGLNYSFTTKFSMDVFMSYVNQQRTITPELLAVNHVATNGFGDAVILLKYKLTRALTTSNQFFIGLGVKLPTGKSDLSQNGITLNADMQPGSGAWDAIVWGNYMHNFTSRPTMNFISTLTVRLTGKNDNYFGAQIYELGDEFQIRAGISDRYTVGKLMFDPSLSFRYRFAAQDLNDGSELPNTGGEWIMIVPAINFNILANFSLNLTAELPLYARVDGTQLSPTVRYNFGLLYQLPLRKNSKPTNIEMIDDRQ